MTIAALPTVDIVSPAKAIVTLPTYPKPLTVTNLLGAGDQNTKLRKNSGRGFDTIGFAMTPHALRFGALNLGNVCPNASPACAAACLNHTGLGAVFSSIQAGRAARRILWATQREWFLARLRAELHRHAAKADRNGKRLACRLNIFSDVPWESFDIVQRFPNVEFYDYTKDGRRVGRVAPNYWLTFSRSETNDAAAIAALQLRWNVAVVFHNVGPFTGNRAGLQQLPKTWQGFDVIDGDKTDLRFTDPRGRSRGGKVIGLRLKAPNNAQRQSAIDSGFSVEC